MTNIRKEIYEALIDCLKYEDIEQSIDRIVSLFQKQMEERVKELEGLKKPLTYGVDMITNKYYNDAISDAQEVLRK